MEDLAEAADEISDAATKATCGDIAPDVALVSVLASMTRNETVELGSETFNQVKDLAEKGGILMKENYLLTLESKASTSSSGMESTAAHLTHRMVSKLHYGEALRFAYGRLLGYLHAHHGLTWDDMVGLGMVDEAGQIHPEKILPGVEAQISMRPGPQIWPFAVSSGPTGGSSGAATEEP